MSKTIDLIRPDLRHFKAYSSARDEAKQGKIWLNANELPWNNAEELSLNRYPEKQAAELLEKISEIYAVEKNQVVLSRGSDEGIDLLTRIVCRAEKDAVMICPPTFGMYEVYAQLQGAKTIKVPLLLNQDFQLDINAIKNNWTPEVKIIFLCSPNNPTGNVIDPADILDLCRTFAGKSLIVLDEAYIEFSSTSSCTRYINQYENLVILRTFSKAYGLAGARLGLLLTNSELVSCLLAILAPYPLAVATVTAALQALSSQKLKQLQEQRQIIKQERDKLLTTLANLKNITKVWPSEANFILFRAADGPALMQKCLAEGIVLRNMHDKLGLQNCIRMSVGNPEENNRVIEVLIKT